MSERARELLSFWLSRLRVAYRWLVEKDRSLWQRFHQQRRVPIEVLAVNRARRRSLQRELRAGLRSLRHALGAAFPTDTAIVVQQVITTDRQLAGCYQVGQDADGRRFALIRLALQVNDHQLSSDELLAVLAEQCIGIAMQQSGGLSVVIPIELAPVQSGETVAIQTPRRDPLTPLSNGHQSRAPHRAG